MTMETSKNEASDPSDHPVAAYVVLTHRGPEQTSRLVAAIRSSSPRSHVFVVHDDRRFPVPSIADPRVHVRAHGQATDWGSWSLVLVTLKALAWARSVANPDMFVFVSGQDYPVRPLAEWESAFLAKGGWMGDAHPLSYRQYWGPRHGRGDRDLRRYLYRWVDAPWARGAWLPGRLRRAFVQVRNGTFQALAPLIQYDDLERGRGACIGFRRLRNPFSSERPCYKGSQWFAVDRATLKRMLRQTHHKGELWSAFRHSIIPDEGFIQTALAWEALPQDGPQLTYCDWSWADQPDSPKDLELSDLPAILESGAPFCRKVDLRSSAALLAALDAVNGVGPEVIWNQDEQVPTAKVPIGLSLVD